MGFPWQKMTVEEFAAFERSQGVNVVRTDGVYWRQVRPFFYRPLLATQEYVPRAVSAPPFALLGGFQHAVPAGASSNSFMNLLIFDDTKNYSTAGFSYGKRKRLKTALQRFVVRPIEDVKEFNESAYPVFLSFYERTHYSYKPERRESSNFSRWGESLFRFPKNLILGAYQDGRLQAVCISQWVEDVVIYASMFCSTEALKQDATALMLHSVREAVAKSPEVHYILAGAFKYEEDGGVDNFFLERG